MTKASAGLLVTGTLLTLANSLYAQNALPASSFVDSVGVNLHLHYDHSAYADQSKVRAALRALGVKHIRDGMVDSNYEPYLDGLRALGADGIRALLITDPKQDASFMRRFPDKVPGVIEGVEGPNELDAGKPDWVVQDRATEDKIAAAFDGTKIATVAPSLTQTASFAVLGTEACPCKYGNLHNYFGGRNPGTAGWGDDGYGSYPWALKHAKEAFGDKPLYTTESGYINDPARQDGIPEEVAGEYTVRLLLEQFLHGIRRTYLYELVDTEIPEQNVHDRYGLLRSDFSPRPSFTAVSGLMRLLHDERSGIGGGRSSVRWSLQGGTADVHHLALQKNNGDIILLLWREVSAYDVPTHTAISVNTVNVTVSTTGALTLVQHFAQDGSLQTISPHGTTVRVDDRVTAITLAATKAR